MRNLILNYWKSPYQERVDEVNLCISNNIKSELFDNLVLFVYPENSDYLTSFVAKMDVGKTSIKILQSDVNVTYVDMFNICNLYFSDNSNINILANSDIEFDRSIELSNNINDYEFYALTRYNDGVLYWHTDLEYVPKCGSDSQDVWIWRGTNKIKTSIPIYLGVPGCDNRISYEAMKSGYIVTNPSLSIKTHHKHSTNLKGGHSQNANNRHPSPYVFLKPIEQNNNSSKSIACLRIDTIDDLKEFSWMGNNYMNYIVNKKHDLPLLIEVNYFKE